MLNGKQQLDKGEIVGKRNGDGSAGYRVPVAVHRLVKILLRLDLTLRTRRATHAPSAPPAATSAESTHVVHAHSSATSPAPGAFAARVGLIARRPRVQLEPPAKPASSNWGRPAAIITALVARTKVLAFKLARRLPPGWLCPPRPSPRSESAAPRANTTVRDQCQRGAGQGEQDWCPMAARKNRGVTTARQQRAESTGADEQPHPRRTRAAIPAQRETTAAVSTGSRA
jgi:hypothetical protein